MIKTVRNIALFLTGFTLIAVLAIGIAIKNSGASRSDIAFLQDLGKREGIGAVWSVIRSELFGVDASNAADPSYGRELIAGRGNAPWVIRSNLDGMPRMLSFALAPDLWASYDVQRMSLYQVWQGRIIFDGSAYNYQHGPQPVSEGTAFYRDPDGAQWFLLINGQEIPARVVYRGHEYGPARTTAGIRYEVVTQGHRVTLVEWPDVVEKNGERHFSRRFEQTPVDQSSDAALAVFYGSDGKRYEASGTVTLPLTDTVATLSRVETAQDTQAKGSDIERGEAVIAGSDCLGCHAEHHRIAGPAWSQISGKFRGKIQEEVVAVLANSVRQGAVGTWGQIPMPAHPSLSEQEAREAVIYILSVGEPEIDENPPVNAAGEPYAATYKFDNLPRLDAVHPSFTLENLAPAGFEPKVGGMDFRSDGKMIMASWDLDGAVYLIDVTAPIEERVKRIGEGLHEPLGLKVVNDRVFVLQKQELTELIDTDGDDIIDVYATVNDDWQANPNFHSFAFGLEHQNDAFYFLLSICVLPGGASCPEQLPMQGKLLRANSDGSLDVVASGFRTPNGIVTAADGALYVTDNQGDWLPASKLVRISEGAFYGSRAVPDKNVMAKVETPPAVWLPQDEVGNSPTQPLQLTEGPYAGQFIHGDVYNGGIKRVFLERVDGREQGAAFHFSAGFQGAVNRLERGPDNAIYIGETGNPPNWGEYGKPWYGFEKLTWQGDNAFEMVAVRATPSGFDIELTQPLADDIHLNADDLLIKQWFYAPNEQYGGPKYDETELRASALTLSQDRKHIRADINGLREGYIVYLRLDNRLRSARGATLWTAEAWYTLNAIVQSTGAIESAAAPSHSAATGEAKHQGDGWRHLFDGTSLDGWRNYGKAGKPIEKWGIENGELVLEQGGVFPLWGLIKSVIFGGGSNDLIYYREKFKNFELSLEWKISENGNSGIFYLVADEKENTPWLTGIEMQVLHNEGHADGQIETHRAGDLYDLIAAQPETVKPPGEWNKVLIRVINNRIEHWLNGVKVVEITRGSPQWDALVAESKYADMPRFGKADSGYIVLQDHGDPVWYRNIKVREVSVD